MFRKEVNVGSPLRVLDKSLHGGLGKGNLGVVMARAGVGKTTVLVQIGLDDLMRDRTVLHVALGQTIEHVQSHYDAMFADLAKRTQLEDRANVAESIARNRIIAAFPDHDLWPERLRHTAELFREHINFRPAAIIVDGFNWEGHGVAETAALLGAFKSYAKVIDAELWMTAQTHRDTTGAHPGGITPPCHEFAEIIDVALFLEPHGEDIEVRLLKDHGEPALAHTHLHLRPRTLQFVASE